MMSYAEAIAIAVPSSTFIVTIGWGIIRYKGNNSGSSGKANNSYVGRKEFVAVIGGIATELKLTREGLTAGINDLKDQIRGLKP